MCPSHPSPAQRHATARSPGPGRVAPSATREPLDPAERRPHWSQRRVSHHPACSHSHQITRSVAAFPTSTTCVPRVPQVDPLRRRKWIRSSSASKLRPLWATPTDRGGQLAAPGRAHLGIQESRLLVHSSRFLHCSVTVNSIPSVVVPAGYTKKMNQMESRRE